MITHCPHCANELNFTDAQLGKIAAALKTIKSGTLKLRCPKCSQSIELRADGSLADWRQKEVAATEDTTTTTNLPEPPLPPDIDWLTREKFDDDERIRDIPKILVLVDSGQIREQVASAFIESFFQPVVADTVGEALEFIRGMELTAVLLHSGFDGASLRDSEVHQYMRNMPMARRRYLFYMLIGPEFHTLYSLEALTYSANLVINDNDAGHMKNIYRRGKDDYDALFGGYISMMEEYGIK